MVQRLRSNTGQLGLSTTTIRPPRTNRPGPATKSTTIQPRLLPHIWTRWLKESDSNQDAISLDAEWEEDTNNESENTQTQSEGPEVPVSILSQVYTIPSPVFGFAEGMYQA